MGYKKISFIRRNIASIVAAASGFLGFSCSGDYSLPYVDYYPTKITLSSIPSDGYEHQSESISAEVTDESGLVEVKLRQRVEGEESWTETDMVKSGDIYSKILDFESDAYELQIYTRDEEGKTATSDIIPVKKWADEISGDSALDSILSLYESDGIIDWYDTNYTIDIAGNLIEVDALVRPAGQNNKAIFYKGENDGDLAFKKSLLESNGIEVIIINACLEKELDSRLEAIKDAGWQSGEY